MGFEFLKLERDEGVAVLTLNRPATLNAWNQKMRDEMREAVRGLVADDSLRVLVVTGEGTAFSAGEDVRGMQGLAELGTRGFRRVAREIHNVFDEIEAMEVPVIAALNGVAAGGGLELALSCDFRFAAEGTLDADVEAELVALRESCFQTDDFFEGVRAFAEKRQPEWKGR